MNEQSLTFKVRDFFCVQLSTVITRVLWNHRAEGLIYSRERINHFGMIGMKYIDIKYSVAAF